MISVYLSIVQEGSKAMQVVSNNNQTKINPLIAVLIFCLAVTAAGRVIETPTLRDNRVMDIRAGRKTEITVPAYNFQKIYQRSVLKEVDGQYVPYDQCQTNPGEVELDIDDTLVFEDR